MPKSLTYRLLGLGVVVAGALATSPAAFGKSPLADDILGAYNEESRYGELTIGYPLNETLFPPDIASPTFRWKDTNPQSDVWLIRFEFQDDEGCLDSLARRAEWAPLDEQWDAIKRRSLEKDARVTIIGVNQGAPKRILSSAGATIRTSKDEVAAPLFYREVNLPFLDAVKDPSLIRWRFGEVSSKEPPPIVLEGLPVCGNCHSFSADGRVLGMDVDYANDKGSYVIAATEEEMVLAKNKIITWSDYKREDKEFTFGLLSQVSPDGKYVVSTVKDRSVFVPKPDIEFSQLFFPLKGILVIYRRDTGTFHALPGADDKSFVQSNPTWSPDGKSIVFARSRAYPLRNAMGDKVLLTQEECREFLKEGKTFLFDLYRIPFNDGKGGNAEALEGASENGMSNYFPKYSPDGKWIVFCKAKSFMLLQPDSELYIMPAGGGNPRRMRCNTPNMNSWHSWSPNGRWLVFSSKTNGAYTQLFLTHVDPQGNDTPPVVLARFTAADRAANIPEFVNVKPGTIRTIREQFVDDLSFVRAGWEFRRGKDYDRAVEAFRKALDLNPRNVEAHTMLGSILVQQGKSAEAVTHCTEALRLDPDCAEAHNNLGVAFNQQGKLESAVGHFTEAIRLNADHAVAHSNLGSILVQQGKSAEAVTHCAEAIRLNPDYAAAHHTLGVAYAQQGKLEEAVAEFTEAVRLDPSRAQYHNNLGLALEEQGKVEEAIASFTRALKARPGLAQARLNLRRALQKRKLRQSQE